MKTDRLQKWEWVTFLPWYLEVSGSVFDEKSSNFFSASLKRVISAQAGGRQLTTQ